MFSNPKIARRPRGFSLVEIMVAMAIGMFGILIIMQVFLVFQGQKRTTMGAADAQENGLVALNILERDIRTSGLGVVGLGCTQIKAYNANSTPATFDFSALPVKVTQNSPAAGADKIATLYSTSAFANIPTKIVDPMPDESAILKVDSGDGFYEGSLMMISEPGKHCSMIQASQDGQKTGQSWNVQHNPGGAFAYNPPGGQNIFPQPAGCTPSGPVYCGYGPGSKLSNMGSMVNLEYYVENERLMVKNVNLPASASNPIALVDGIFAIKAQYGWDKNAPFDGYADTWDNDTAGVEADPLRLVAIRLAVVARSGTIERRQTVTPSPLVLWTGGPELTLSAADQNYRFKVYQTTIPLKNVIWNN